MNWSKMLLKAALGLATFVTAYLASNPGVITKFIPENIAQMTIGGAVAAGLVALANWLKHKNDK